MDFAGLHVFRYSKRPGTPAARMRGHLPEPVKKARSTELLALSGQMEQRFGERFEKAQLDVLWEQITGSTEAGFINVGYTDNYIRVRGVHPRPLTNHITPAQIGPFSDGLISATPIIE
jgi:threonylcarbamoyladenosine tRNA methylthiotransferase MtaB